MSNARPPSEPRDGLVHAAGGIVRRRVPGRSRLRQRLRPRYELALVHRPRYDDWSFPKGKRDRDDEGDEDTALREVEEETGLSCALGHPVGETRYEDSRGRAKVVRYWLMDPPDGPLDPFVPNREVDEVRWLEPREADRLLTYPHDRALLHRLSRRGPSRP
ncbi:MAG TPA: NUDIX hydrolase [Acidimicrobiia bacterium]|nr:NUDIX hydrolase [Acidimicrobiia bacterium]